MGKIYENYQALLSALQSAQELSDITFKEGFSKEKTERPVKAPICAISDKTTEIYTDFYSYQTFRLKVYSPLNDGGKGCYSYINRISEYILTKLSGIVKVKTTTVEYDTNAVAFVACIDVKCKSNIFSKNSEEGTPVEIEINSESFNAGYCRIYNNRKAYPIFEVWGENPRDIVFDEVSYVIVIGSCDSSYITAVEDIENFNLQFDNVIYYGCKVFDVEYNQTLSKVETAKIYAKRRLVVNK